MRISASEVGPLTPVEVRKSNLQDLLGRRQSRNLNPPAAAEADQASSEGGGDDPPAGDGSTPRPEADCISEFLEVDGMKFLIPDSEFRISLAGVPLDPN